MGLNGYQVFVRHDDPGEVEAAIRDYVAEHGVEGVIDPDGDRPSPKLAAREQRTFALSPPVKGTIAVWEDGSWSDRRMAQHLSRALGTEAIWLMLNDATDSWAYARYERGEEKERAHESPKDLYGDAERFAQQEDLPFAFEYLPEAGEDPAMAELTRRLQEEGFYDVKPVDAGQDEPEPDEEPVDEPESALDAVRDDLVTFTVGPVLDSD